MQLVRKVADGSAVEAFLANSPGGQVLLQVSRPQLAYDPELYGRFLDVANRSTRLRHPGLLTPREARCANDGRFVLTTGTVSGRTAADHLREHGPLTSREAVRWGVMLSDALAYLHDHGLVHGALSPSFVYLEGEGDLQVPRLLETGFLLFRATRSLMTPTSLVLVPPEYLSPERVAGHRGTPASDFYGLGVLLYELLTGGPPFRGRTAEETRSHHVHSLVPDLPAHLSAWDTVLSRCLAKAPRDRYLSAIELRRAVAAIRDVGPASVVPPSGQAPPPTLIELEPDQEPERDFGPVAGEHTERLSQAARGPSFETLAGLAQARQAALSAQLDEPTGSVPGPTGRSQGPEVVAGAELGQWILEEAIGEGGMARVFRARHRTLGRKAALKLLRPELYARPAEVRRFVQEAQAVNRVNHPHIVQVHDLVEEAGLVYFVMELLEGRSLKEEGRARPIPLASAIRWVRQAGEALAAAHQVGVIHRDVKPDNLFVVAGSENIKVLDFGVARIHAWSGARVTEVGQVVGTPLWMAPEQVLGRDAAPSADVYSLATVLYVLLMRRFPFAGTLMSEVVLARLGGEAEALGPHTTAGEKVPGPLRYAVSRCLSRNEARRPSMATFVEALVEAERRVVAESPNPTPAGRRRRWWKLW